MEGVQGETRDVLPCRGLEGTLGVTSWGLGVGVSRRTAVMDGRQVSGLRQTRGR